MAIISKPSYAYRVRGEQLVNNLVNLTLTSANCHGNIADCSSEKGTAGSAHCIPEDKPKYANHRTKCV
jgi:hypothetical protein